MSFVKKSAILSFFSFFVYSGTDDSGHYCHPVFNEVNLLRQLSERHKHQVLHLLTVRLEFTGGFYIGKSYVKYKLWIIVPHDEESGSSILPLLFTFLRWGNSIYVTEEWSIWFLHMHGISTSQNSSRKNQRPFILCILFCLFNQLYFPVLYWSQATCFI